MISTVITKNYYYYYYYSRYRGCSGTSNGSMGMGQLISSSLSSVLDIPVLSTPSYCWDTVHCRIISNNNNNVTIGTGAKYFGNITGKREREKEQEFKAEKSRKLYMYMYLHVLSF